jgi:hypothetical protein
MAGLSILRVVSNDALMQAEREHEARERELDQRQQASAMLGLRGYLRQCWDAARIAKKPIETIMLDGMRQRNGEYTPEKLAAIRQQGGSEVFMMITEVKCRAAESWLRDILLDTGTPPWGLEPSPIPEMSPEIEQTVQQLVEEYVVTTLQNEARAPTAKEVSEVVEIVAQEVRLRMTQLAQNKAERMALKIADQFAQGGWAESFNDFITDLVTYPGAVLKGPVVRRQRTLGWSRGPDGKTVAEPIERIAPEYERVDPFRFFPEPGITKLSEGYCFQHHPLTRTMLAEMIGVPGYDEQAVRKLLELGATSANSWVQLDVEFQKEEEERKYHTHLRPTDIYDALEFWGKVSGQMLREWGMSEDEVPDPALEYDANVWVIGDFIVKAVLNYDPLGEKPYSLTSFIKRPGSLWGSGIPEIIEDLQNVCNAAARALVNNMGISSGPQVEVNLERIPANEDITQIYPWKIWQVTNDPSATGSPAVRFTQPEDNASTLMAVYERFSKLADEHSGIPAYLYGDLNVQGAGRTSSGLSMLMGSAGKAIRQVVMHIDADVIKPNVTRQYVYNMRYDEDEDIKGDLVVMPRGAINLAMKETMNVRRLEFLTATANPIDLEIMGKEGRAAVLREVSKGLQMPTDDIVPSREKAAAMDRIAAAAQAAVPQGAPGGPGGAPQALLPDGSPKGGMEGNVVMNRNTSVAPS